MNVIEMENGNALDINLREDGQGRDRVILSLLAHGCELDLSPHQARVLATELIMAVNRAEVRNNLKHAKHAPRSSSAGAPRHGLFGQAFAK
ncbi:MAG: hypothetical protein ACLGH1_11250 [Gammaproteobacteria bacterium]